jgi:hypothetical protein
MPAPDRWPKLARGGPRVSCSTAAHLQLLQPNMHSTWVASHSLRRRRDAETAFASGASRRALVDASGDIAVGDPPPASGWTIEVMPLSTSGTPRGGSGWQCRRDDRWRRSARGDRRKAAIRTLSIREPDWA